MDIRRLVERFMKEKGVAPTQLGRWAVRDPRVIFDMRNGRQIGANMEARLRDFMASYRPRPSAPRGRSAWK